MKKSADYGGAQQDDYMMGRHADLGFSAGTLAVLRGVFVLLSLSMATTIFYTCSTDGAPFRKGEVAEKPKSACMPIM